MSVTAHTRLAHDQDFHRQDPPLPSSSPALLGWLSPLYLPKLLSGHRSQPASAENSRLPSPSRSVAFASTHEQRSFDSVVQVAPTPKRRQVKTKTCYHLARPHPTTEKHRRIHRRPKLLLQLHRVTSAARPVPSFDVVPASTLTSGFFKRFPKIFRKNKGLRSDDLVVFKAENYARRTIKSHIGQSDESDDESWEAREAFGVVCFPEEDTAAAEAFPEVCLDDGSVWKGKRLPNGNFEFMNIDHHGQRSVARWVVQRSEEGVRYNFSPIAPQNRKHPVVAVLNQSEVNIYDSYNITTASTPVTPMSVSSRPSSPTSGRSDREDDFFATQEKSLVTTSDQMRALIIVSATMIALRGEPSYNPRPALGNRRPQSFYECDRTSKVISDGFSQPTSAQASVVSDNGSRDNIDCPEPPTQNSKRLSMSIVRRGSKLGGQQRASEPFANTHPLTGAAVKNRANSTSALFMRRASSVRSSTLPSTLQTTTDVASATSADAESNLSFGSSTGQRERRNSSLTSESPIRIPKASVIAAQTALSVSPAEVLAEATATSKADKRRSIRLSSVKNLIHRSSNTVR